MAVRPLLPGRCLNEAAMKRVVPFLLILSLPLAGCQGWQSALDAQGPPARALADMRPATVFHCAGSAHVAQSWADPRETLATNVLGTHHLLDGLRKTGVSAHLRQIFIRSSSRVARPLIMTIPRT